MWLMQFIFKEFSMSNVQLLLFLFVPITAKDTYVTIGSTITLICPFKRVSTGSLQWTFIYNSSILAVYAINDVVNTETLSPELYTRLSITGNYAIGEYNLQVRDIRETDEGRYKCEVSLQQDQQALYLIVPLSSVGIQNVTGTNRLLGTEGQDLTVSCVAVGGKPPPSITLKVDQIALGTGNQSVSFTFKYIGRSYDRKKVTCLASNEANINNPIIDTAVLYLNLRPLEPIFSPDPVSTAETRPLVVSCTSTGSRPQATIQWTIGMINVTSGITTTHVYNTADDTYTVTSTLTHTVDRTYKGNILTCVAPDITVTNSTYSENTITKTVSCIPFGNPATYTYYRWQHMSTYGELIRTLDGGQNGVLTLPSVPVEDRYLDSGEYVCTASNGITGRDGKIQQSGSGYVTVNAQPTFTNDNDNVKFGEFGKNVDIHMYVYSLPKYTSIKWYKMNTEIVMDNRYHISELEAIVNDTSYGIKVKLNGYRVTLTIKNLMKSDFNVSYRLELSNGVGQPVVYTTLLESTSAPETPKDFTFLSSSECSIVVQWEAGYNGGHEQTFYVEYRGFGTSTWESVKILDTKQSGRQIYTVNRLQDGTSYELRMYAENKYNKSLPTETKTIQTIKASKLSPSECATAGVAGGLSAVILLQLIINIVLLILWRKETGKKRPKAKSARWKAETSYHNPIDCNETDGPENTLYVKGKQNKTISASAQEYETLGMKENPNTYSALQSQQEKHKTLAGSAQEYETLDMKNHPNTYSALLSQQGQQQSETNVSHYESVSEPNKSTVYENT